ncbi:MAG TPA: hypothetical protein VGL86_01710 [Polyangia bacterium]|jgi:hypothetical protein
MSCRAPARATLAIPLLILVPAIAHAKVTIQGTGTVTAGYTDNVLNAPDQPTAGASPREGDALFQLIPGVVIASLAPRFMERLVYTFTADLFARHSEADSYSNMLDWAGTFLISPTSRLTLTLDTQQGRISTFTINQPSSGTTVGVLAQNNSTNFFSQDVAEDLDTTPAPGWRVTQGAFFRAFVTIDRGKLPDSYNAIASVGAERLFAKDAVGLTLSANFVQYIQPRDPTTDVPLGFDDKQVLTSLAARWRRDWSPMWNTEADLGVISLVGASADPTASTETTWQPSALAALRWVRDIGSAELHYLHTATPNSLAGNTFAVDEVALQAGVPLLRAKMLIGATVAYQHAKLIALAPDAPQATADLALLDVTIGYQALAWLRVFVRYSLYDQFGSPAVNGAPSALPDLTRNVVMAGANVVYPAVAAVRAPLRGAARVDEADQQAFPEPHAAPPQ